MDAVSHFLTKPSAPLMLTCHRPAYEVIEEKYQLMAIDVLSRICCVADAPTSEDSPAPAEPRNFACPYCDRRSKEQKRTKGASFDAKQAVQLVFTDLIKLECFTNSQRPRVVAMIAMRRVINHTDDPTMFDLETSPLGQWCLQSLHSSVRELRIAAGYVCWEPLLLHR